ncbi:unnamed protein product, partial [Allacma fusca]
MKFILIFAFFAAAQAIPWIPECRDDPWWKREHEIIIQNAIRLGPNITTVFYGDSITEGWGGAGREVFDREYAPLGTANHAIGGDRTEHLLCRIPDEV